jgi:predicted PhzF superfamily epimerase YddE/YHI9
MKLRLFQVDAFASRVFAGNPAAVVPLERWLDDATLQAIAAENNLSETAFFVGGEGDYAIRWMTPVEEVDLCGHATLASGWVVMNELEPGRREVGFRSKSGPLSVAARGERLALDFPAWPPQPAVFDSEGDVRALQPDMAKTAALDRLGVIATAPGRDCDFVSRFFAPGAGIPEDPVTGRAHCTLVPYWSKRLGRTSLFARQVSKRGGELWCEHRGERVEIAGHAVKYLEGVIELAPA